MSSSRRSMQKIGKPSRQKISGKIFSWTREMFQTAGIYVAKDIEVSGWVCCSEEERRGRVDQQDSPASCPSCPIWVPPDNSITEEGGLKGEPERSASYLERRRAEFAPEAAEKT